MKRKLILFSVPSKDFYVTKSHLYFRLNFHVVRQVWEKALQLFLYRTVADVGLKKFNDFSWKINFFRFATHLTLFRMCLFRAAQGWEEGWSVVYFVTAKETRSEPSHGYDNFFCIIFLVKKFLQDKFSICVTLSAFVKYFTTNPIIRTMHSHRIPFGSNLINLIRESSRNDHEFIQLIVCAKVTT